MDVMLVVSFMCLSSSFPNKTKAENLKKMKLFIRRKQIIELRILDLGY